MLEVEIGYYNFIFPDEEYNAAFDFAKTARNHISKEDSERKISISFLNEKEETE